ncbi:MAG TPA: hypothetical protein VGR49_03160, partial [Actinomycetota bacterium]|nr:hypothetical protein [Actinomycetota bacterium]
MRAIPFTTFALFATLAGNSARTGGLGSAPFGTPQLNERARIDSARAEDDWPDWRGPHQDGRSPEKNLPSHWSPGGENLAWKAPYGSRSGPVIFGDRLYIHAPVGDKETVQERVVCLNADTGAR